MAKLRCIQGLPGDVNPEKALILPVFNERIFFAGKALLAAVEEAP